MKNIITQLLFGLSFLFIGVIGTIITGIIIKVDFSNKNEIVNKLKDQLDEMQEKERLKNENTFEVAKFVNPVDDKFMKNISSEQGLRDEITLNNGGTAGKYYHNAIDIVLPEGTRVNSTKDGIVTNVYPSYYNGGARYKGHPIYGGLIEIQHNDGTKTIYAHLSLTTVKEGDYVKQGQKIGESGGVAGKRGSGYSTGPHLHYAIILDLNSFTGKTL